MSHARTGRKTDAVCWHTGGWIWDGTHTANAKHWPSAKFDSERPKASNLSAGFIAECLVDIRSK